MAVSYEVKQGDCIFSIAFQHGFFADTIWNHPNNKDLKEKRKDPNVLMPGDTVYVPDKRLREYSEATNQVYKYKCKNTPKTLRIQFKYIDTPIKNVDYKLTIDGKEIEGKTDGDGWLKQSIQPNAKLAKVLLADGAEYEFKLGNLDPIDETAGVKQRLQSLGIFAGSIDGKTDDEFKAALKVFQFGHDLEPTGEVDGKTKDMLTQLTGK
jgi:N-acetylmuramoyl-L-alanine amidase